MTQCGCSYVNKHTGVELAKFRASAIFVGCSDKTQQEVERILFGISTESTSEERERIVKEASVNG